MKTKFHYLLIIILVCHAYGNTVQSSFHFDDIPSILEKPWIRGIDKIPDFIFSFTQRPLVILSFNINYTISEFEVWSYHIFNIILHLLVVLLIYRLGQIILSCMTQSNPAIYNVLRRMPLLGALIFALHPLNTQAVTYISGRSSIMATVFYLATIILFFEGLYEKKYLKIKPNYMYLVGSAICLLLGFLCKLIIISLPAVLVVYHYYFISSQDLKTWWEQHWKWISAASGFIIIFISYKKLYGGGILKASATDFASLDYFRTQMVVIPFEYFRKMLFPFNLTVDSDFQLVFHWASVLVLGGLLVLGIFLIGIIKLSSIKNYSKTYSPEAFGLLWILITLSPTSSVVPLLDLAVEHRTYISLVGYSLALASILLRFNYFTQQKISNGSGIIFDNQRKSKVTVGCIFILLVIFMIGTMKRNQVWIDEVSLWTDAKEKAPFKPRAYNNLGEAYDKIGNYDRAISEFEAGLRLNPNYFFALSNLGNVYGKKKEYAKAIGYFKKALQEKSDYPAGHYNLAKALHMTGYPLKAADSYRLAIKYNPYFEEAFFNLGFLALELKNIVEAVDSLEKFIEMRPKHSRGHLGLGTAYSMMGKQENARKHYESSIKYDPEFLSPYINLANLNLAAGKITEAKNLLKEVLSKNPNFAGAHKNLGIIFLQEKNFNNASRHLNEYLRLRPLAPDATVIQSILQNKAKNNLH